MKKVILPSLLWPLAVAAVIAGILHLGGDFPDIHSYVQPRLGAALLVMYITSFGLFCEFDHRFLKKLFPLALVLPLLWMGTFTWPTVLLPFLRRSIWGTIMSSVR